MRRSLVSLAFVLVLPLILPITSAVAATGRGRLSPAVVRSDGLTRALTSGRIDRPTYALERARALFDLAAVRSRYGDVAAPTPREATMVLRDLLAVYHALTPAERRIADAIAARPTSNRDPFNDEYSVDEEQPLCSTNGCIHYVATTADAPPATDANTNGVPDWVETVRDEFETVWTVEITDFGFRPPKPDDTSRPAGNPDERIDIYLKDIGDQGLYGYCYTDDPNAFDALYPYFDFSSYCVIDDDFAPIQFPNTSGLAALRVTLAHEFFHASQFAYDAAEDRWFMESTATWIEDEVFDAVNDNVQYLPAGALGKPRTPLDANNTNFGIYGNWIFHRFLSEYFEVGDVHDTSVLRQAWELAAAGEGDPDRYSIKAIATAIGDAGDSFREVFALFGMRNAFPDEFYDEAVGQNYPKPPRVETFTVTRRNGGAQGSIDTRHLTNAYFSFEPAAGLSADADLRVRVNLPPPNSGSEASVIVVDTLGAVTTFRIALNDEGNGSQLVDFGNGTIASVDLVLTNASTRRATPCWRDDKWRYSCAAFPKDDGRTYAFAATLIEPPA